MENTELTQYAKDYCLLRTLSPVLVAKAWLIEKLERRRLENFLKEHGLLEEANRCPSKQTN